MNIQSSIPIPAHILVLDSKPLVVSAGDMVQIKTWADDAWAEVLWASSPGSPELTMKVVRHTENADYRYTEMITGDDVRITCSKIDLPIEALMFGSIDLAGGKVGRVRRRWTSLLTASSNIHSSQAEHFKAKRH